MARILVPLAAGCEELEAVTVIDLLRRADIEVVTVGLDEGEVRASRGTVLVPDTRLDEVLGEAFDMVVLPGGLPGADHLAGDERVIGLVQEMAAAGRQVAAICAAPKVLARAGVLDGRNATSYPGVLAMENRPGVKIVDEPVVVDGNVTTSRGPGTAMDFALRLIETLAGKAKRDEVEAALQRP